MQFLLREDYRGEDVFSHWISPPRFVTFQQAFEKIAAERPLLSSVASTTWMRVMLQTITVCYR
jgi:hypothetical protein